MYSVQPNSNSYKSNTSNSSGFLIRTVFVVEVVYFYAIFDSFGSRDIFFITAVVIIDIKLLCIHKCSVWIPRYQIFIMYADVTVI